MPGMWNTQPQYMTEHCLCSHMAASYFSQERAILQKKRLLKVNAVKKCSVMQFGFECVHKVERLCTVCDIMPLCGLQLQAFSLRIAAARRTGRQPPSGTDMNALILDGRRRNGSIAEEWLDYNLKAELNK